MSTKYYDIVIIGGGIHGAGAAQAATAAGYSVLVLEQTSLAAGTSSRSSKLIHGGLRYLESAQFGLVRECLHERTLLLKLAPELVTLQPFIIPIYAETTRRPWQIRSGLTLYAALGGLNSDTRYKITPRRDWDKLDGLNTLGLEKVFQYYDAQTDDAALTQAVMHSAQTLGATLEMPAEFIQGKRINDRYLIDYKSGTGEKSCEAGLVINASGPWVNRVLQQFTPVVTPLEIDLIQGTHIILDGQITHGIYYVEAPQDQRAVFVMPWKNSVMVGTTETPFSGDPSQVTPLSTEVNYLCQTLTHYFPQYRSLSHQDINESFAGLRVLPRSAGAAFSRPRDTIFHTDNPDEPRLVTIYGGKLTAYRATSERLINHFVGILPQRAPIADTKKLKLSPA